MLGKRSSPAGDDVDIVIVEVSRIIYRCLWWIAASDWLLPCSDGHCRWCLSCAYQPCMDAGTLFYALLGEVIVILLGQ